MWVNAATEAGWSTSLNPHDAKVGSIAVWAKEVGSDLLTYVALVQSVGPNGRVTFAGYSKEKKEVTTYTKVGTDILHNGEARFRGYIFPNKSLQ